MRWVALLMRLRLSLSEFCKTWTQCKDCDSLIFVTWNLEVTSSSNPKFRPPLAVTREVHTWPVDHLILVEQFPIRVIQIHQMVLARLTQLKTNICRRIQPFARTSPKFFRNLRHKPILWFARQSAKTHVLVDLVQEEHQAPSAEVVSFPDFVHKDLSIFLHKEQIVELEWLTRIVEVDFWGVERVEESFAEVLIDVHFVGEESLDCFQLFSLVFHHFARVGFGLVAD